MIITRDGSFSLELKSIELAKGIRTNSQSPINEKYLTSSKGAVGHKGVLQSVDDISGSVINTTFLTDGYPYPQIFICDDCIIICGKETIYEVVGAILIPVITVTEGIRWSAVVFGSYIYLTNGKVSVVRNAEDKAYSLSDLPIASTICDFNGQVMLGAPNIEWT